MINKIELNNLGTLNKNQVLIETNKGKFKLFFSYQTIIGFDYYFSEPNTDANWHKKRILDKKFSTTTSKFQNELEPNKENRTDPEMFKNELSEMFLFMSA